MGLLRASALTEVTFKTMAVKTAFRLETSLTRCVMPKNSRMGRAGFFGYTGKSEVQRLRFFGGGWRYFWAGRLCLSVSILQKMAMCSFPPAYANPSSALGSASFLSSSRYVLSFLPLPLLFCIRPIVQYDKFVGFCFSAHVWVYFV